MATTNPNVPADQAAAATGSAPNASVTPNQPAQLPAGQTTTPGNPNLTGVPTDVKQDRAKDQDTIKKLSKVAASDKDYFEQQEEFAKSFEEREGEDSFRRAARIEREREAAASTGDPIRDPVAKQKAMDMNTVQPGAVADAQKIKDIGTDALKDKDKK